jgi:hypothetical protein
MILEDLRDNHLGETVWVLGSGPTLGFIDPGFFDDKVVVATNLAGQLVGINQPYVFTHYHHRTRNLAPESRAVVTLAKNTQPNTPWAGDVPENVVLIPKDSYAPPGAGWDPFGKHEPRSDSLAYGSSSFHGAMHLAAWLGAHSIILVGADCGTLDSADRIAGYPKGDAPWALYNKHHKLMKDWLVREYGVGVYSLNPFINLNLEGHVFRGP